MPMTLRLGHAHLCAPQFLHTMSVAASVTRLTDWSDCSVIVLGVPAPSLTGNVFSPMVLLRCFYSNILKQLELKTSSFTSPTKPSSPTTPCSNGGPPSRNPHQQSWLFLRYLDLENGGSWAYRPGGLYVLWQLHPCAPQNISSSWLNPYQLN